MSSGLTYDNSGILVGTSGTTRALTVSSTGTVGIGYLNNTTVPSSTYALDVSGILRALSVIHSQYFIWHFNWNTGQSRGYVAGYTGICNSTGGTTTATTNIPGTFINTPSNGRLTVPVSGVYGCYFHAVSDGTADGAYPQLRIDGSNYNPNRPCVNSFGQVFSTEFVYANAGQVLDFFIGWESTNAAGLQSTRGIAVNTGFGQGITFVLMQRTG
uniref:Uncharacterized protein n=1 Tax=viral metagenome TaxID=1070528 RepID=A0A6C0D691_9ZZZZ